MTLPDPTPPQSSWRWLLFFGAIISIAIILLLFPSSIQRIIFLVMVFVGLTLSIQQIILFLLQSRQKLQVIHHQQPLLLPRLSLVMTVILIGLSAYFYQPQYMDSDAGFYLFILSLPFMWLSFALLPDATPAATHDAPSTTRIRWFWIAVSLISMALLTMMNIPQLWVGQIHRALGVDHSPPHIQILTLAMGIISLLLGFGVRMVPHRPTWKRQHTLLLGIIVLAAFMRLWNLEHAIRMFVDEILFILGINGYDTDTLKILVPVANAFTDVFSFFQYAVKQIIGPGLSAVRIPSAIFGVLSVVGVYALGRQLFSLRVALLSAFLLAVMPVHVQFSRIGLNNIAGATIAIWVFVYMLRGMRHQRLSDYAIAGTLLGLTQYFYEGDRLFVTPFVVCWIIWMALICRKSQTFHFPTIKYLLVLVFTFLVIAVPFYHALISHERQLTERYNITHDPNLTSEKHLYNILFHGYPADLGYPMARYIQFPADGSYYQSQDAFVLPMLAPFFLIGFAYLLRHIRTYGGALLWWWAVGIAVGNSLISQYFSAVSPRYVSVYPILMIIAAIGISLTWSMLVAWVGKRLEMVVHIGFIVFLAVTGTYNSLYYFNDTVPNFYEFVFSRQDASGNLRPAVDDMILRALALPDNTDVHIFTESFFPRNLMKDIPDFYGRDADEFAIYHQLAQRLIDGYFLELPRDRNYVFVFTHLYDYILYDIERFFTITKVEGSPYDIPDEVEMMFYYVPLEANRTLPDGSLPPELPINTHYR